MTEPKKPKTTALAASTKPENVKVIFTGTTGDRNFDVATATGGGAKMENGKVYTVPAKLAESLTASAVWKYADADEKGGTDG